jgi:hypothetical protein
MTNKGKCPCSCHNPEAPTAPFLCMTGVCYQCSKEGMQKPHPAPEIGKEFAIPTEDTVFKSVRGKDCRPTTGIKKGERFRKAIQKAAEEVGITLKEIEVHPGYAADELGNIYSRRKKSIWTRLIPYQRGHGHLFVQMCFEGERKLMSVHRLIALTFIPNPENKPQVNHVNGNPSDNRAGNLYWGNQKENIQDALRHGTWPRGERSGRAVLNEKKVRVIKWCLRNGGMTHKQIAKYFFVSSRLISYIATGENWKHVII